MVRKGKCLMSQESRWDKWEVGKRRARVLRCASLGRPLASHRPERTTTGRKGDEGVSRRPAMSLPVAKCHTLHMRGRYTTYAYWTHDSLLPPEAGEYKAA